MRVVPNLAVHPPYAFEILEIDVLDHELPKQFLLAARRL